VNAIEAARALGLEDCGDGCSCHGSWSEEERVDVAVHESFDPDFHSREDGGCGYAWAIHRPAIRATDILPFGCPRDEAEAASRWGRE
jgi:hypothetical protein